MYWISFDKVFENGNNDCESEHHHTITRLFCDFHRFSFIFNFWGGELMIKRVEHVGIMAADMDESIRFYETLLDFKVRVRVNIGQKELVFLTHEGLPGFEIELIRDIEPTVTFSEYGLVNHLAFVVDDIVHVIDCLKQEGVVFQTSKPKNGIGRKTIRFKGPNGEVLQLVEERHVGK